VSRTGGGLVLKDRLLLVFGLASFCFSEHKGVWKTEN
jgi:hypothetical protein